ncbi:MAG TPA: cellulase family glycosylhydrolase [Microbacteriaceae bacterium]|nr:cellulase family glycosylhydrolase [Microbacteriaceae bacterium]
MHHRLPLLFAAIVLTLAAAPHASAAPGVKFGLTDDAWLTNGSGTLEQRLSTLDALGVRVVRFTLRWDQIAHTRPTTPADPSDAAYDWSAADPVLDGLKQHGIDVVLQLVGTPAWANGGKASNYAPASSATFGAFATAAAHQYPFVRRWVIWNEPNQVRWLRPTTPTIYTIRLLNPAYAAIHGVIPGAQVAGGGTAPRGATGGVSPVAWIAGMHAAHARLDAYAHNPYPLDPKRETPLTGGCNRCTTITMATIGKLVTLVGRDFPRARIWLTEYGYQSNPPDRLLGVSLALQARYIGEGAYVAYRTPKVDLLIHFLYRDEPSIARFQSGLATMTNAVKPASAAFQLPLAQISRSTLWGQLRAPSAGTTARIERLVGSRWQTLATVDTGVGGYFRWTGTLVRGTQVRVRAGPLVGAPLTIH